MLSFADRSIVSAHVPTLVLLDGTGIPYVLSDLWSEAGPNVFCLPLTQLSISFMLSDSTQNLLELPIVCGDNTCGAGQHIPSKILASCQRSES